MAKSKKSNKQSKPRRIWRNLLLSAFGVVVFLLMFVAAFVFNPFEGSLPELRDVVPRGVNFFVRKQDLADDFHTFPVPKFWTALRDAPGFDAIVRGPLGQRVQQQGLVPALQEAERAVEQVRRDSDGWLDILRDVIGEEVIFAGYNQDHSTYPPRPLPVPRWCLYTRVSWRVKALHGLLGFGFVQSRLAEQGVAVSSEDDLLVLTPVGQPALYLQRHLDALMLANDPGLLVQAQQLLDGNRDEEPIGQQPAYRDGAAARIGEWARDNDVGDPNVVEFVVEPNAFDGFRRFAAGWPNPQNRDSLNERVLATFLNLKGWMQVTGGLIFDDGLLAATGQIGLNSKQHTQFQEAFYRAEQQRREQWLDPFLNMVPASACAAAALRMPAGDFLHAMFDALEPSERELLDGGVRAANFQGQQLRDVRDLIDRLSVALQPRTGFVFRRNKPDLSVDENGELMVPVASRSPMPQVAWVFWLRQGGKVLADELVTMLRSYSSSFGFRNVYHLSVPYGQGNASFQEKVTEFTNPQIPATGEVAMIVFRDFFVLSNSGPLIRDILRTRYPLQSRMDSIRQHPDYRQVERELPGELSGLIWINGSALVPVLDDYLNFADSSTVLPDPEWMQVNRPAAEEEVRRTRFPQYRSKAAMGAELTRPGGAFDQAVVAHLRERWARERTSFTAADRAGLEQLRGFARLIGTAAVQVELQPNYVGYQMRVTTNTR